METKSCGDGLLLQSQGIQYLNDKWTCSGLGQIVS